MTRTITILLAVLGVMVGGVAVVVSRSQPKSPPPARTPPVSPFPHAIAAAGLVEAGTRNIAIAPPESGLLTEMLVDVGDHVEAGAPLFRLDARTLEASRLEAEAEAKVAQAQLAALEAQPRPERVQALRAALAAAEARLSNAQLDYERLQTVSQAGAASWEELSTARHDFETRRAERDQAKAQLTLEEAGTWEPDLAVARAQRDAAEARVRSLDAQIERLTVRAPIAGQILKRNAEPGEFVDGSGAAPLVMGDLSTLRIRARVDEEDTPMLRMGAAAKARLRGRGESLIDLRMVRIEPLAIPKVDLTNMPAERVDTRVVEALFEVVDAGGLILYPGVLVDVFIDASGSPEAGKTGGGA